MSREESAYFWTENRPPKTIFYRHERTSSDRLSISCTQTSPLSHQRRVVNQWCEILPALDHVRVLWFQSKVSQQLFDAACQMRNLEGLWIHFSSIKDLTKIVETKLLRHIYMGSSPGIQSIEPLGQSNQLKSLHFENLKRISDWSPLANLKGLEGLYISGGLWAMQKVKSLEPFSAITSLQWLDLGGVQSQDLSLRTLGKLHGLKSVVVNLGKYPIEELAWLRAKLPAAASKIKPFTDLSQNGICKKCQTKNSFVLLFGKGSSRTICKICSADKLARHVALFNACVERFARE